MNKTKGGQNTSSDKASETRKQHYAGTGVAKQEMEQHDSVDAPVDSQSTSREPEPMEAIGDWWEFIIEPRHANAITAIATVLIFLSGVAYTAFAYKQWKANEKSAGAAKSAADTAAKQLELTERPWVDANISLNGPFFFDINGANISLKVAMRNTGHAPALAVGVLPTALFGAKGVNAPSYRAKACRDAEKMSDMGMTLFPNTNFEQPLSITIGKDDIENGKASKEFPNSKFGEAILSPTVIVCIAYRPAFKSASAYHTAYILDLFKTDSAGLLAPLFKIGEDVDTKHLLLRLHPMVGISAD